MDKTRSRWARWALPGLLVLALAGCRHHDDGYRGPDRPPGPYYEDEYDYPRLPPRYRRGYPGRRMYRGRIDAPDGHYEGGRVYRGKVDAPGDAPHDGKQMYRGRIDAPDGRWAPPPRIDPRTGKPVPGPVPR